jgi:hypothetical protein
VCGAGRKGDILAYQTHRIAEASQQGVEIAATIPAASPPGAIELTRMFRLRDYDATPVRPPKPSAEIVARNHMPNIYDCYLTINNVN